MIVLDFVTAVFGALFMIRVSAVQKKAGILLFILRVSSVYSQTIDCKTNRECAKDMLCIKQKCLDPCLEGVCGQHTTCHVNDHIPMCGCEAGYAGNPFTGCYPAPNNLVSCSNGSSSSSSKEKTFHLYQIKKMGWYQSLAHCNSLGLRLATINSKEEQDKVVTMIKQAHATVGGKWWVGGSDLGQSTDFMWMSTGLPMTYQNFRSGEPSSSYHNKEQEHCVGIESDLNYEWNDVLCNNKQFHVCEA